MLIYSSSRFPQDYDPPAANPLENREKKQVHYYRSLRNKFRDGPYYTILGPTIPSAAALSNHNNTTWTSVATKREEAERRREKLQMAARASFNPFKGMPKYSNKFHKKQRRLPDLKDRKYGMLWIRPPFG
jgi:DNA-directed RNA polymerase III subunit RPC7